LSELKSKLTCIPEGVKLSFTKEQDPKEGLIEGDDGQSKVNVEVSSPRPTDNSPPTKEQD
jgi:hypothetical protein